MWAMWCVKVGGIEGRVWAKLGRKRGGIEKGGGRCRMGGGGGVRERREVLRGFFGCSREGVWTNVCKK